ncbi:hypothetical protein O6P37_18155 [Mycobacterium sp. CPCC 205372]|uniref:Low molecular weight antigen MTB12-like C-terminal domain-containing protein n=1 Tax=Mycobacterium hippophais TaxID=3016340 RepID=A0ABT4PW88_9MYCO|nr:hypothetical protein [Mycobacterium hippophais]MCZ8380795.1 hypothetical protein [Mycobacterium hippophais]
MAAFGLVGCSADAPQPAPAPPARSTPAGPPPAPVAAPLPPPSALTDVLYRLADVNVPGAEKTTFVEEATNADTEALDRFGRALTDNGYHPMTFDAADLAWSESDPGNVTATVIARTPAGREGGDFTFPMEFARTPDGGWQLTHETAELLFALNAPAAPAPPR